MLMAGAGAVVVTVVVWGMVFIEPVAEISLLGRRDWEESVGTSLRALTERNMPRRTRLTTEMRPTTAALPCLTSKRRHRGPSGLRSAAG